MVYGVSIRVVSKVLDLYVRELTLASDVSIGYGLPGPSSNIALDISVSYQTNQHRKEYQLIDIVGQFL